MSENDNSSQSATIVVKPKKAVKTRTARKPKKLPPYHLILLDDNDHTYEYVIEMLAKLFAFDRNKGFEMAWQVDRRGRAIIMTTTKDLAMQKQARIHGYGADWRMGRSAGSMSAVVEPASG